MLFSILAQTLPQTTTTTFNFGNFLLNAAFALLWSVVAAIIFSLVAIIALRIFSALTPGVNELAELKNGNIAVGIIMAGFILAIAAVVMAVLLGGR